MALYYFAYGSNLHPLRLQERAPSARFLETAVLPDRALHFCKRSVDGSAKCTVTPALGSRTFGAVYLIDEADKESLDRAEGLGQGYVEERLGLPLSGGVVRTFYYSAAEGYVDRELAPYHWYKQLVLAGARHHGFPEPYLAAIEAVESVDDPNPERRRANEALLDARGRPLTTEGPLERKQAPTNVDHG